MAFLARIDGRLAGFVLISKALQLSDDGAIYDVNEFFVLRRYRHQGIGRELAEKVWLRFPGNWKIRVRANNILALKFWASCIAKFIEQMEESAFQESDGAMWHIFTFDSRRRPERALNRA
jgi:predicted acetyltransferase